MKRIILMLIISFTFVFLSGCKNNNENIDTPEKAVNEIITRLENHGLVNTYVAPPI